ncbi:MAG TPA: uroporphyrinogen-III synthase [Gemmataceae bacterium]|nr:uroporphyrinogen-III synthase [Gemmataceae bacterium]
MTVSLQGRVIALAENRQLEELAGLLEAEGATALRYPLVRILDAPDEAPVLVWVSDLIAGRFDYVVLFTGEGVRRLLGFAERAGMRDDFIAALGRNRLLTRGPKPVRVLKELGLSPWKVADSPTTEGVICTLRAEPIAGKTIGVQMYSEANPALAEFLATTGAKMMPVLPYVYAPAADAERVADLIGRMARGEIDALVFTSSPQVERLFEVATERKLEGELTAGLARTKIASVGPVVSENLTKHGIHVEVCPRQGFVMKNLVKHIRTALTEG